jgi:hypothetical protein
MYVVSFHSIFNENAVLLAQRLKIPYISELNPQEGDVIIVFAAHEQADKLCFIQEIKKIHFILIQTEQFPSKVFDNKYYMELIQNNSILDWSRYNVERMKKKIEIKVFSFYHFDFIAVPNTDWDQRPIDFFFCGAANESRKKVLEQFQEENAWANIEIDLSYAYTSPPVLFEKLKQVKYVLNLPFYEDNALETHRINRALSAGCEVISTYSKDKYLNKKYEPYVHFVKELDEFTPLIEQERKGDYKALMEDFGQKTIDTNLRAIENIAKKYETPGQKPVPIYPPLHKEEPTDFAALLRKKKEKEKEKEKEEPTDFAALLRKKKEKMKEEPTDFAEMLRKKKEKKLTEAIST